MNKRNLDIEVLRAVAILGTLIVHVDILLFWGSDRLSAFSHVFSPWGGVDLFFCISGYVITGNLLRSLDQSRPSSFSELAFPFWIKRVWRIFPSAWLWATVMLVLSIAFSREGHFGTPTANLIDAAAVISQVANFRIWSCFAIPGTLCGGNVVYWSLSLEEQSYMLLPLLLFFCGRRIVVYALAAAVLAQLFLHRPLLSFLWFFRTDALALGALIAIAKSSGVLAKIEPRWLSNGWRSAIALALLCALLAAIPAAFVSIPFHTGLLAITSAAMIWIASYARGYTLPDGLIKRAAVYIGARSYAIYLIHIPVYLVTREIWSRIEGNGAAIDGHFTVRFIVTATVLILVLAELNFRLIEQPLRRYGVSLANKWESKRARAVSTASTQNIATP
ncbi:acyltransferase [Paraburkholderia sp. JHI869]|uniref:acyltransferase family protein n=1 Tax=Paraburkholderia sp. JHI869 TaxID=3112959 RepID=UPI0031792A67